MVDDTIANNDSVDALRPAPDFSPLALEHLHASCLAVRALIKQAVTSEAVSDLVALNTALADIHHTLLLLERHGAALVSAELRRLVDAMVNNKVSDAEACAHTLVLAGEQLTDYVAHLRRPGAVDSALPLLPVINNCRACRQEPLLSEMLVVASGITLPDASGYPMPGDVDIGTFVERVRESRQTMMLGLIGWFRDDGQLQDSLAQLAQLFAKLAEACDAPTRLQPLVTLFESAEFICQSVSNNALDNSAALQRLFAQLERLLDDFSKIDSKQNAVLDHPVPDTLFLNLLYYVALSTQSTPKAVALRRRFRLDRFMPRTISGERALPSFDGVGDRLADSIRDSIDLEIEAARQWLDDVPDELDTPEKSAAKAVLKRMHQLEPAILLLGATESLRHLRFINSALLSSASPSQGQPAVSKEQVAESLIRLERALDTELNAHRSGPVMATRNRHDNVLQACLQEAQQRLLRVEQDLLGLFPTSENPQASATSSNVTQVLVQLQTVDSALQILPLPEVSPLLSGVQQFITDHYGSDHCRKPVHNNTRRHLATVMVSLGYYLNSVMQPNDAAGQLLLDAEMALIKLEQADESEFDNTDSDRTVETSNMFDLTTRLNMSPYLTDNDHDATRVDQVASDQTEFLIERIVQQLPLIHLSLGKLESHEEEATVQAAGQLSDVYGQLHSIASRCHAHDISRIAQANMQLPAIFERGSLGIGADAIQAMRESAAVLPQLANQLQSNADKVLGLDELFADFDRLSSASIAVSDELLQAQQSDPDLRDDVDFYSDDDTPIMTLDNTLEQVFVRECEQHIETLKRGVDLAINSGQPLPDKDMLRALHTLAGSAQTVGASSIFSIAQPLQKSVLHKQHTNDVFNEQDTLFIRGLVDELQTRLSHWQDNDHNFSEHDVANSEAITEGLNRLAAGNKPLTAVSKQSDSIEAVFKDESRSLLEAMRDDAQGLMHADEPDLVAERILGRLHTLKGSARMAGQQSLADRAHELEEDIQQSDSIELESKVQFGLADLQKLMLLSAEQPEEDVADGTVVVEQLSEGAPQRDVIAELDVSKGSTDSADLISDSQSSMGLSESAFEQMLSLSTAAAVSQARLGECLLRLRDTYKDLESTSTRLQSLQSERLEPDSAAVKEMFADLHNAKAAMADALLDAETEQQQGSRADSALQQSLIRVQLVSMRDCAVRMGHAVSDAAFETDKQASFEIVGGEVAIERSLYRQLLSPLEHLVRNAVVHGIESPAARLAVGKPAQGAVTLHVQIDGTDLLLSVSDNGGGIDSEKVSENLVGQAESYTESNDGMLHVLCQSGFSTLAQADQLAGRGLGLSAVKSFIEEHHGLLHMRNDKGQGAVFTLRVPQKIRVHQVVLVQSHQALYAIPVSFVQFVVEDMRFNAAREYTHDGEVYKPLILGELLGHLSVKAKSSVHSVLVEVGRQRFALCVEHVLGFREIIAQPIGDQLTALGRYTGGSVLADGRAALIPDLNRLLLGQQSGNALHADQFTQVTRARAPSALVVDDSITLRVAAEQMMIELGYVPTLARDGSEALALIENQLPDVLLVDIDMPRLNGFDFLRHVQLQYPDHQSAIIMISTRDAAKDREEATSLGAGAYLVKPYTQQALLSALEKIGAQASPADPSQ